MSNLTAKAKVELRWTSGKHGGVVYLNGKDYTSKAKKGWQPVSRAQNAPDLHAIAEKAKKIERELPTLEAVACQWAPIPTIKVQEPRLQRRPPEKR